MRTRLLAFLALALVSAALPASAAAAEEWDKYDIDEASASLSTTQAGAHADFTTTFLLTEKEGNPYARTRDVIVELPAGLFGNPEAFPKCTTLQFGTDIFNSECPQDSQVGATDITIGGGLTQTFLNSPIYNMPAPGGGTVARFGFYAGPYPMFVSVRMDPETNRLIAAVEGALSMILLIEAKTTFWGVPADPVHDAERLTPEESAQGKGAPGGGRDSNLPEVPFMTNPTSCEPGKTVRISAVSYQLPGEVRTMTVPFPQITGCGAVEFSPTSSLAPTTSQGSSATGLNYGLSLPTKGLQFGNLNYGSMLKRTVVTLPEGMTLNPSAAEGLGVCSEAELARERYDSPANVGCPETSKIGSAVAKSPVLDREVVGSLYLAKPYENRFGSLIALYLVLKVPDRGVLVKLAGRVDPDPRTGQLVTTFDDVPELPVASFELRFREGARAPLITPRICGSHTAVSNLVPWSTPAKPLSKANSFQIASGPNHGACPAGGVPPFRPGFLAGAENGLAGSYSPFHMRVSRQDGDQDLTKFSATLPPGVIGKLAGVEQCPEAAIAQARARTGPRQGRLEQASPSCPPNSQIGRVSAGAGVGSILTYATGKVYLAGPTGGAPLSVVAIVPAVAGPFDVGTVVTRQALRIDPRTALVTADGDSSDPIPHILAGIPLTVRDIRVYVDRPNFTLNPTSCKESATQATLWGSGVDVFSPADDMPFGAASRFQVTDCASLGFKPRLNLTLRGATKRGGHPGLRGVFSPRRGDANLAGLVLRLPSSAFLEQAHIRTICTRVQFAANGGNGRGCPQGAIYGRARAWTPILDEPLEGPVFLRSSNNKLPDFVATLRGLVDVETVARIDSVRGGIRATFTQVPDAPISRVVVNMRGAKKGLIVNSTNLCRANNRANANFAAHNGRRAKGQPLVRAVGCGKQGKGKATRSAPRR